MAFDTIIHDPPEREALMASAVSTVGQAAKGGHTLSVQAEAMRLLGEHPGCGLTLDEIEDEVARIAAKSGVAVEFG